MEQALFPECQTAEQIRLVQDVMKAEARLALAKKFAEYKNMNPKPFFD